MKDLQLEFEEIKERHESKIKALKESFKDGYIPDLLNLRKEYNLYVSDLYNLFDDYNYVAPYELYKFFYQVSAKRYNLLFSCSERIHSGNLAGAFLKEAVGDLELTGIHTLLCLERENNYIDKDPSHTLLSIESYDAILETQSQFKNSMGYAIDEEKLSNAYADAASKILSFLGSKVVDKAQEYYKTAIDLLKSSRASIKYHSGGYYTYYVALYKLLVSYRSAIEEYGVACDFDIDREIYECTHENYRQAQSLARDNMTVQVNNLIKNGQHDEAYRIAKEIICICEERCENIRSGGIKLSLKNAYELTLSIPELSEEDRKAINEKLQNLLSTMTHGDFYCKDGDREYPVIPF